MTDEGLGDYYETMQPYVEFLQQTGTENNGYQPDTTQSHQGPAVPLRNQQAPPYPPQQAPHYPPQQAPPYHPQQAAYHQKQQIRVSDPQNQTQGKTESSFISNMTWSFVFYQTAKLVYKGNLILIKYHWQLWISSSSNGSVNTATTTNCGTLIRCFFFEWYKNERTNCDKNHQSCELMSKRVCGSIKRPCWYLIMTCKCSQVCS